MLRKLSTKDTLGGACTTMDMFRRRRRSFSAPRNIIQSYKKVIDIAPESLTVNKHDIAMSEGVDSVPAGQTSPTDNNVPVGAIIKNFNIDLAFINIGNTDCFVWITIQQLRATQTGVNPRVVGGNPQRNQVFRQIMRGIPPDTNANLHINFKIPKRFQRVRDGDTWIIRYENDNVVSRCAQIVYKFYR